MVLVNRGEAPTPANIQPHR